MQATGRHWEEHLLLRVALAVLHNGICFLQGADLQCFFNLIHIPAGGQWAGDNHTSTGGEVEVVVTEDGIGTFQAQLNKTGQRIGMDGDS